MSFLLLNLIFSLPLRVEYYLFENNYDVLFCEVKNDGNPRLIKIFKTNELLEILEWDVLEGAEEKWLFDVAPGTYDQERD